MAEILKFACEAPNCGRRFSTQAGLDNHISYRHPLLLKNKDIKSIIDKEVEKKKENSTTEEIIKQISKTKINPHEKHKMLQPIDPKGLSSSLTNNNKKKSKISANNENKLKEKKETDNQDIEEVEIPNIIEEKQKKLLNNLFGQINSLENYLEKDCEFHQNFNVPQVPDYDKMYDSDNEENKVNEKNKKKNNEQNLVCEITEDMIFKRGKNNSKEMMYEKIQEINLSGKNVSSFKNKKNVDFKKLTELYRLNI
jgi:flagellar motor protein MotB